MKRLLKKISIKKKLVIIIAGITSFTLAAGFVFVSVYSFNEMKQNLAATAIKNAELMGEYSIVPLTFADSARAEKNLSVLRKIPSVYKAVIYNAAGNQFAKYRREASPKIPMVEFRTHFDGFKNGFYHVFRPIARNDVTYGTVYLAVSTRSLIRDITRNVVIFAISLFVLSTVAALLALIFQNAITAPILKLAKVMDRITREPDYATRVTKTADDEIGRLYDGFNSMLERIEKGQRELDHLRNYLANIIDSMPSVIVGVDTEGRVTQWNREAENRTGLKSEEAAGRSITNVLPRMAAEWHKIEAAMRERRPQESSKVPRQADGETRYENVIVYPLRANGVEGAVIRIDDVSERVRLEDMMIQSEKMMSVGGLAAGMAHEINNPLAGIIQNAEMVERRLTEDIPPNREAAEAAGIRMDQLRAYMESRRLFRMLTNIRKSGSRAADIVQNMLSFARKSDSYMTFHDLNALLDKSLALAETDYDLKKRYDFRQIDVNREYDPELPKVRCERSKIQQVFLNILKNSAEAMSSADDQQRPRFVLRTMKEGGMVRVEIEDNGPGMDEATRKRVFEPFFTTKPVGEGTGLGMSVSYFIITENHNGEMAVASTPGKGAKFIVRLPIN